MSSPLFTVPGVSAKDAGQIVDLLQRRLISLGALDHAYSGVVAEHRAAIDTVEGLDKVTQDVLIEQSERLERFHWFVRAHLESAGGRLSTEGSTAERDAKASSRRRAS